MDEQTMDEYTKEGEMAALAASRKNQINILKSEWNAARNVKEQAPSREEKAEKNYYLGSDQSTVYNNIVEKRYRDEAKKKLEDWDNFFLPKVDFINDVQLIFKSQRSYVDNLDDVEYNYKNKYHELKQKVNDTGQEKKIADRLSYYTDERNQYVVYAKNILKYIYYLLVVAIIAIFIYKKQYLTHKIIIAYIIAFLLLPYAFSFVLTYIQTNIEHVKLDKNYVFYAITVFLIFKLFPYFKKFPKNSNLNKPN